MTDTKPTIIIPKDVTTTPSHWCLYSDFFKKIIE